VWSELDDNRKLEVGSGKREADSTHNIKEGGVQDKT
jgi:hypothetical protein